MYEYINEILNDAIKGEVDNSTLLKKILNILGKEVTTNIKALVSILAIILIHSILKAITEGLENNNISKLIYYVQYILIVTVIMSNFTEIIKLVQDTTGNLVGFVDKYKQYGNSEELYDNYMSSPVTDSAGNYLNGLARRRQAEFDLFNKGIYTYN